MAGLDTAGRTEQGWNECRAWIAAFDGSPNITLLVDTPDEAMLPALERLADQAENLRITAIPVSHPEAAQYIPLASFPDFLAGLRAETTADLNINYAVRTTAFDLDIHLTVYAAENQKLILELVWWSDQVFSAETDNYAQFKAIIAYFISLQELFSASHLLLNSESTRGPGMEVDDWVEI